MAQAQSEFIPIKEAAVSGCLTKGLTEFNIASILDSFIKIHSDFKDIRQSSFQMFDKGHVQVGLYVKQV